MRFGLLAGCLALVLLMGGLARGRAAEPDLIVGVEELEYYPFFAIRDGDYVGAAREILDAFGRSAGYRIVYRPLPIKRLVAELLTGGIDARFPDSPAWAAEAKSGRAVVYSKPVLPYVDGVMVRPSQLGLAVDEVRVLATISGFSPEPWQSRLDAGKARMANSPRLESVLREVVVGHADGAYVNVSAADHLLASGLAMPGSLQFNPALPHIRSAYVLSSVTRPEMIARFNDWLDANGPLLQTIRDRFGTDPALGRR